MPGSTSGNSTSSRLPFLKLDPNLYGPTREEADFLKSQTKIESDEELKQHVITVQKEAWDVVNYRCIQNFGFITLKISHQPIYPAFLQLGKERSGAIYLDFACCFGNDVRKAIADGFPVENAIASDLQGEFWNIGHKLFRSTPETFPVPFIQGNVLDEKHISPAPALYDLPTSPRPVLSELTSLTPLQGHASAIHVSDFFHLFRKDDQIQAVRQLASLLSPLPGSMIFGTHSSLPVSSEMKHPMGNFHLYCFSPEDWCALWDGEIFRKGSVRAEAELIHSPPWRGKDLEKEARSAMVWSVTRI
ncbi:uncharacterized protein FOMMEDRAFT_17755 [Fomitiporia mediterranea MF3/22]|uniref:uncharacterized protein n=1 Tax=Fomitiporia mediterranea (strain MF3/22) TaxID=694068 RepID=UPI00044079FA|nr:uncharacterized protein FOMMEDRAFT_17755 [Fomitiporia mediterranea MF3/22]EJD05461.1 hypothetical protein FOMMEDRAFT_17755 [Fomitiporia mediterranea MF3/22]